MHNNGDINMFWYCIFNLVNELREIMKTITEQLKEVIKDQTTTKCQVVTQISNMHSSLELARLCQSNAISEFEDMFNSLEVES